MKVNISKMSFEIDVLESADFSNEIKSKLLKRSMFLNFTFYQFFFKSFYIIIGIINSV